MFKALRLVTNRPIVRFLRLPLIRTSQRPFDLELRGQVVAHFEPMAGFDTDLAQGDQGEVRPTEWIVN